ncbi:hypothetical protein SCA6_010301 [Theobroma cacao]
MDTYIHQIVASKDEKRAPIFIWRITKPIEELCRLKARKLKDLQGPWYFDGHIQGFELFGYSDKIREHVMAFFLAMGAGMNQ